MSSHIVALLQTIHTLRSPGGCPWDRKQTLMDAARYLLEEAGELLDATLAKDTEHIKEELADLLFMVCFCCEILGENHPVNFETIAKEGNEKLIRRHPHVFGDRSANNSTESQEHWNEIKAEERKAKGLDTGPKSVLKNLPASTAPLYQAYTFGKNAAAVGFDWPDVNGVWEKIHEELSELQTAVTNTPSSPPQISPSEAIEHEMGDLLFAVVNLSRHLGVLPDIALRKANQRFRARFTHIEKKYAWNREKMKSASLTELEAAWQEAKGRRSPPG